MPARLEISISSLFHGQPTAKNAGSTAKIRLPAGDVEDKGRPPGRLPPVHHHPRGPRRLARDHPAPREQLVPHHGPPLRPRRTSRRPADPNTPPPSATPELTNLPLADHNQLHLGRRRNNQHLQARGKQGHPPGRNCRGRPAAVARLGHRVPRHGHLERCHPPPLHD